MLKFPFIPCILLLLLLTPTSCLEYKLAYLTDGDTGKTRSFQVNAAAPHMAIERARDEGLLGENSIQIIFKNDKLDRRLSMGYSMEMYENQNVDGFIGVGSSYVVRQTGYLYAYWNLPVLSQSATNPALGDKAVYKTLLRLIPPYNKAGNVVAEIVQHFKWTRVVIIDHSTQLCKYSGRAAFSELSRLGVIIPAWIHYDIGVLNDAVMEEIIETIKSKSRIVYFCGTDPEKELFLLAVHKANLTTPEFVYIFPPYSPLDFSPMKLWKDDSNPNKDILLEASRAVLQFTLLSVDEREIKQFAEDHVVKMMEYWNYNMTENNMVTSNFALFLHDSVYLYAVTLNKTLEQGNNPRNGSLFVETAKNVTFKGVSGLVALDENGDRQPTCSLYYVKPDGDDPVLWAEAILSNPVGQRMKIIEDVIWRTEDGTIPPDTPKCGFKGEFCAVHEDSAMTAILATVFVVLIAVFGTIGFALYIRTRPKAKS